MAMFNSFLYVYQRVTSPKHDPKVNWFQLKFSHDSPLAEYGSKNSYEKTPSYDILPLWWLMVNNNG